MSVNLESQVVLPRDLFVLRSRRIEAFQRLLGTTITIPDAEWQAPSGLPGWTRAHVASHLARGAEAFCRLLEGVIAGDNAPMYATEASRWDAIERGSERSALELQIDLDETGDRLNVVFANLYQLPGEIAVTLPDSRQIRLDLLPVARMSEVILHHLDLNYGFTRSDIEADIARWLLEWNSYWLVEDPAYPNITLHSDSGFTTEIGVGPKLEVSGSDALLLCWITGRLGASELEAAGLPALPLRH